MTNIVAHMNIRKTSLSRGFTLIELLIVMVILSILAVIVTGTFASSSRRGRDSRRKDDLRAVASALEAYYSDKGHYPTGNASGQMVGCCGVRGCGDVQVCAWGGQFQDTNLTLYMVMIPQDPVSFKYFYVSNGTSYQLYAKLENTLDEGNGVKQTGYAGTNCGLNGTVLCTYGVASSNTTP